jgi:hypothetical protein
MSMPYIYLESPPLACGLRGNSNKMSPSNLIRKKFIVSIFIMLYPKTSVH